VRAWLSLAVLFVAVSALGGWLYHKPRVQNNGLHALSDVKPEQVDRIRIERRGPGASSETSAGPPSPAAPVLAELARGADGWRVTAPFSARADSVQVERLLAILATRSAVRYPAADLARYGLLEPAVAVTLDDQTFSFGAINTISREQYVLTRGAVHAIALAQRHAPPREVDALISRLLFAPNESPVRFELPQFTGALTEGAWSFTPAPENVAADERNAWADAWRHAIALTAARDDGRTPVSNVIVQLKDGRKLELGVLQLEPELVLLRADEGVQYHFLPEVAKKMLSLPGKG
jgi:hypothetical protein